MKKMTLIAAFTAALLAGCSKSNDVSQECLDLIDVTLEVAESAGKPAPMDKDEMLQEMQENWSKMSDSEKDKATQDCKKAAQMMEMLKNMGG